jgi:hypothetical protein
MIVLFSSSYITTIYHASQFIMHHNFKCYLYAGNGYFSNMMMDETNLDDIDNSNNAYADQQSQAMQVGPSATSTRPNHNRENNFSDHEDEILVSAWLNI